MMKTAIKRHLDGTPSKSLFMISRGIRPSSRAEAANGRCPTAMSSLVGWAELATIHF
jgi:hypothetical protein